MSNQLDKKVLVERRTTREPLPQELGSEVVRKGNIIIEISVHNKIVDTDSYSVKINWRAYGPVSKEFARDFANLLNEIIDKVEKKEKGLIELGYKVE